MKYEVMIGQNWHNVSEYIFRSWTGARCVNGKVYQDQRFVIGSDELATGVMQDLCCDCGTEVVTHRLTVPQQDIVCAMCGVARYGKDDE